MGRMVKYYKGNLIEFEILKLVDFYDPILRQPTVPVKFDTLDEQKRASYVAFSLAHQSIVTGKQIGRAHV